MAYGSRCAGYRTPVYVLLWLVSAVLLGLTAFRVHRTRQAHFRERITVELLVASILTLLWVPYAILTLIKTSRSNGVNTTTGGTHTRSRLLTPEAIGLLALWLMWLVGSAIATNTWPTSAFRGFGLQRSILTAILAFAWAGWSLLTILGVLLLMHHAALSGTGVNGAGYGTGASHTSGLQGNKHSNVV